MEVTPKFAFSKGALLACKGYLINFIDAEIPISLQSVLPTELKALLPAGEQDQDVILNYTNLSPLYNSERKFF
jgi:hypothetical protein